MEGLKTNEATAYLPVLVITAQPGHKLRALQAGAKDFISKPFDLVEVKTRIRNMLEVRCCTRNSKNYNKVLEQTVQERTAELRESEARYRSLTELASDWYWEQDENGELHQGLRAGPGDARHPRRPPAGRDRLEVRGRRLGRVERAVLQATIAARQPFLDFLFHRVNADGSQQQFRVSGEPMFNRSCRFIGYRGIGVEVTRQELEPHPDAPPMPPS
jgi:CheY-like chemotaxis protein